MQSQIDEYGLDAQIVDVVVSGSRCRGIEQENSDLDVVVEYTGSTREDDLFNMLHEDSIYIAGIQVDINPITESRTGTLETYLPVVLIMHVEGTEEWEDEQADILSGKCIDVDFLNYTPDLRDTPKVQDAIKKLIAAYPEKDVIDMETKEQKIQTLAAELDQLSQDIDPYGYADTVLDREAQVLMIADDIRNGNIEPLRDFLQTAIEEGTDEDSERQAKELLAKLAEYKPLAKIEEIEEQNYNMIDDRLNNGVEKFNREEEKKEQQEKPQARSSLKERLAAKQKEVAQGKNKDSKEQDKTKKTNREEI